MSTSRPSRRRNTRSRSVEKRVSRPRSSSDTLGWSMPSNWAAAVCVSLLDLGATAMIAASSDLARASEGADTCRSSNTLPLLLVNGVLAVRVIGSSLLAPWARRDLPVEA